jgi:hypothetical protein
MIHHFQLKYKDKLFQVMMKCKQNINHLKLISKFKTFSNA